MLRAELIDFLAAEVVSRKIPARPLLVAIDGRCASGKTTLADEIAVAIAASRPEFQILRPSVDGFHHPRERRYQQGEFSARGYYEDAYDYSLLSESLLRPLSGNCFPVPCKQVCHDWRTDMPSQAPPVLAGTTALLLFEGVFVLRTAIDFYWNLRILVEVSAECSIQRAIRRDAGDFGSREAIVKKYRLRYEPAWQLYVEQEHPEQKADLIVYNEDPANPTLSRST